MSLLCLFMQRVGTEKQLPFLAKILWVSLPAKPRHMRPKMLPGSSSKASSCLCQKLQPIWNMFVSHFSLQCLSLFHLMVPYMFRLYPTLFWAISCSLTSGSGRKGQLSRASSAFILLFLTGPAWVPSFLISNAFLFLKLYSQTLEYILKQSSKVDPQYSKAKFGYTVHNLYILSYVVILAVSDSILITVIFSKSNYWNFCSLSVGFHNFTPWRFMAP